MLSVTTFYTFPREFSPPVIGSGKTRQACYILMLPCVIVLFFVLFFLIPSFWAAWVLAMVLGLGTAFAVATGIYLLGHAIVAALDRRPGRDDHT